MRKVSKSFHVTATEKTREDFLIQHIEHLETVSSLDLVLLGLSYFKILNTHKNKTQILFEHKGLLLTNWHFEENDFVN